ncbi:UDP-glucose 4-epimerase GalE [Deinococcus sp. PEB2-63]
MKVLVTGGAGYIGRTVVSALIDAGHTPVVLDSLSKGPVEFIKGLIFYKGDIGDAKILDRIFYEHSDLKDVMHFAALIDVEESIRFPSLYYSENLFKAQILLNAAMTTGVTRFLFSSTAAVYKAGGSGEGLRENSPLNPLSAYAASKLMFERVLADTCQEHGAVGMALRYFNPIGADPKMRSGAYRDDPSHLLGRLTKLSTRGGGLFSIFGDDYLTRDGTPMRDFIHVWDLAQAHIAALTFMAGMRESRFEVMNVGSGTGVTVREFAQTFLEVSGAPIDVVVGRRRPGDSAGAFADTSRAQALLGWSPHLSLRQGITDSLSWEEIWRTRSHKSKGAD